ncbi:hypothetical protein EV356DRAFT_386998 [Viridothelium virens]|uniref:Uncharacterized protein n=1 Tax=Viridothelium virens TaxID=1048519 RepID=A0A6A6GUM4_VIRVR|nr:hypothetical protein EV356DRAFT_386998 [Viridothelium virens]
MRESDQCQRIHCGMSVGKKEARDLSATNLPQPRTYTYCISTRPRSRETKWQQRRHGGHDKPVVSQRRGRDPLLRQASVHRKRALWSSPQAICFSQFPQIDDPPFHGCLVCETERASKVERVLSNTGPHTSLSSMEEFPGTTTTSPTPAHTRPSVYSGTGDEDGERRTGRTCWTCLGCRARERRP